MRVRDIWTAVSQHLLDTKSAVTQHSRGVRIKHNHQPVRKKRNNHTKQNKCCFHAAVFSTSLSLPESGSLQPKNKQRETRTSQGWSPCTHTHTENPPRRTEKSRIRCNSPGPGILYTQLGLIRVSSARLLKAASWWCVHSMGTGCEFHIGTPKPLPRAHTWNMTAFPMAPTQVSINQSVGSEYSYSWLPMQCPCGMFRNHSTELCLSRSVIAGSISSIQEPKTGHFYLSQRPQKQPTSHQNENCSIRSNSSK